VFSTRLTRDNAVAEFPEMVNSRFHIVPQGRCNLLTEARDDVGRKKEDARVRKALRPKGMPADTVVIVGAGAVQHRKGVDLFIDCAARVLHNEGGARCRFVWIGKGFDPENDLAYSVYLADQLERSGLKGKVDFIGETPSIDVVYATADILLVSSRLDPLPNVAIDAMAHGVPVVCFDKTTGIAEVLEDAGLSESCVASYLGHGRHGRQGARAGRRPCPPARDRNSASSRSFRNSSIWRVTSLTSRSSPTWPPARMAEENRSTEEIIASGVFRPDFFAYAQLPARPIDTVVRYAYVRSWAAGGQPRKPFPGFNPEIYREHHGALDPSVDPFTDYLRAGQPEGPWRYEVIHSTRRRCRSRRGRGSRCMPMSTTRTCFPDLLERLGQNAVRPDLLISVPNAAVAAEVVQIAEVVRGPSRRCRASCRTAAATSAPC
jgi:hypothetical protein